MSSEIWRSVAATNGDVEVSDLGRFRRLARPLIYKDGRRGMLKMGILKGSLGKNGYITISHGGKVYLAHKLAAEAFLPPLVEEFAYQCINHKNGDKSDNRPDNLEWSDHKGNNRHARETGLNRQHGEAMNLSKFSDQLVEAMRRVHVEYSPSSHQLADLFGMSETTVRDILMGRSRQKPST